MTKLKTRSSKSRFFFLYNLHDPKAFGRTILLSSSVVSSLASALTTGLFYTTFLVTNGINLVNISILTFIPYIASCFSVFSPAILDKIQKRRWILAAGRFGYYTFYMLGVTLIPKLVQDPAAKTVCFVATVFLGHILSSISSSGYTAWHINFLPDDVRAEHFGINIAVTNSVSLGLGLVFCLIADSFSGTARGEIIIELFRYIGYGLGLVDVFLLTLPQEPPYEHSGEKSRFSDVFRKPIHNRKFLITILLVAAYTFVANLPSGVLNYYLLEDLGVKYTYIQIINVLYPILVFAFMVPCRRTIRKCGWTGTLAIGCILLSVSYILYGFTAPSNYLILFPIVRIGQHVIGAHFTDTVNSNLPYLNLPREDRTDYMSFYVLVNNAAAFFGVMMGTWFVALAPDFHTSLFGVPIGHCQILLFAAAVGTGILAAVHFRLRDYLAPRDFKY